MSPRTTREIHNEPHHMTLPATPREREGSMTADLHNQLRTVQDQRDRAEAQLATARTQLDELALPAHLAGALRGLAHGRVTLTSDQLLALVSDALGIDPDRIKLGLRGYGGFTLQIDPVLIRSQLDPAAAAIVTALAALDTDLNR